MPTALPTIGEGDIFMEICVNLKKYRAILFDLDGTLIDTMNLHYKAYAYVFLTRGLNLAEKHYLAAVGAPARQAIPLFLAAAGQPECTDADVANIHAAKKVAFETLLATTKPEALAAASLLNDVPKGMAMGLVSSGNRQGVEALLATMGWNDRFGVVISGDDLERGKPHPDPYLEAARRLGVEPQDCLVFEDTQSGLDSARAAGMDYVDVTQPWSLQ